MLITGVVVAVIVIVAVLLLVCFVNIYNRTKQLSVTVEEAKRNIEVFMVRRYDVLAHSVDAVRKFTKHESEVFTEITKLRGNATVQEIASNTKALNKVANELFAVGENYPELRSSDVYQTFQAQISEENENYAAAKRVYNSNVSQYNQYIVTFPANIVAGMIHAKPAEFLQDEEAETKKNVELI